MNFSQIQENLLALLEIPKMVEVRKLFEPGMRKPKHKAGLTVWTFGPLLVDV